MSNCQTVVLVLVDSGLALNIIQQRLVQDLQLPTTPCTVPIEIMAVDNQPSGTASSLTKHSHSPCRSEKLFQPEQITMLITSLPTNQIILSFPWLRDHNPQISWAENLSHLPRTLSTPTNLLHIIGKPRHHEKWTHAQGVPRPERCFLQGACHQTAPSLWLTRNLTPLLQRTIFTHWNLWNPSITCVPSTIKITDTQFICKKRKCEVHQHTVTFLGYVINHKGVQMDTSKVSAVTDWPTPTSIKQLQQLPAIHSGYSQWLPNSQQKESLKNSNGLTPHTFELLKEKFNTAPILCYPYPSIPFVKEVEAFCCEIGTVLSQPGTGLKGLSVKEGLEEWRH